ncbi:siderophore-interacting protein [Streptomyces sp. XM4193]|uniref:siderophore-interacting protein n=1 Tax=Streptomyces sp. XM4193 TaxID=2929782 RepID=UPI001FF95F06|nr:siderophore-interacting protein [Streptomyces sp. XM4193]MCK1797923.1 siderophore-interacting protein [Streptomyces sp. XM4193]
MSTRPVRSRPTSRLLTVVRTQWLTPHMIRVVLGGEELAGLPVGQYTDHYVKLLFPQPGFSHPEPFDIARIREELPRDQWPAMRTYTVRRFDPQAGELTIDFVVHGDSGLAGPWARAAQPGTAIRILGPGGGYCPDPSAGWHLLVGDESALPAIAAAIERMPSGARAEVLLEVEGPQEEQELATAPGTRVRWLHRGPGRTRSALLEAVRGIEDWTGDPQVFVHGEAGWVREIRRHLRMERLVPRERLSVSGYWRLGHDEDGWQAAKPEWNAQVEAEQERRPVGLSAAS